MTAANKTYLFCLKASVALDQWEKCDGAARSVETQVILACKWRLGLT
ncbi:hypothetical protein SAMN04488498_10955 [Mesorhizobium albiziae]|uniref:Uncharacterized protein n=1 Tax=Neomesorhizobium albiziae TaxID=335020 RepID=A0A1I4B147_9HYPH|nr:hypothetical protein SAMN04488498_10955 [Mesorhizobium albiziae]